MPRVSVLIPSYGHAAFLSDAVASVQAQTFSDWEIVLVDDCSPDDSWPAAQALAASEPRLRAFRSEANRGTYGTQQAALERAEGDLIAVLNSDDFWAPEKLALQAQALDRHSEASACAANGVAAAADGSAQDAPALFPFSGEAPARPWGSLLHENPILASGVLFRREGLSFRSELRYSGDWMALLEAMLRGPLAPLHAPLTFWRQHDSNSYRLSPKQAWEEIRVRRAIRAFDWTQAPGFGPEGEASLEQNGLNLMALHALFGQMPEARRLGPGRRDPRRWKRWAALHLPPDWVRRRLWPQVEDFAAFAPPAFEPEPFFINEP